MAFLIHCKNALTVCQVTHTKFVPPPPILRSQEKSRKYNENSPALLLLGCYLGEFVIENEAKHLKFPLIFFAARQKLA